MTASKSDSRDFARRLELAEHPFVSALDGISELADACRELGMKHPLLVTDAGLMTHAIVAEAIAINEREDLPTGLYGTIKSNPTGANVDDGVAWFSRGSA